MKLNRTAARLKSTRDQIKKLQSQLAAQLRELHKELDTLYGAQDGEPILAPFQPEAAPEKPVKRRKYKRAKITALTRGKVIHMKAQGFSGTRISREAGVSIASVWTILRQAKSKKKPKDT